jgi:hypothetical protein
MRIREDDRNMVLLATVTLCCAVVAGTLALFQPVPGQIPESGAIAVSRTLAENRTAAPAPQPTTVRVVGVPFAPNVNPRQR